MFKSSVKAFKAFFLPQEILIRDGESFVLGLQIEILIADEIKSVVKLSKLVF